MSSGAAGAAAAGAAAAIAAAGRQQEQQEEERMTAYAARDLAEDYEFKIVRSATALFRDPEKLRQVLEQEARAGWTLVEKFDDARIRLKRPASARSKDAEVDFDPYRTHVGIPEGNYPLVLLLGMIGGIAAATALFIWLTSILE